MNWLKHQDKNTLGGSDSSAVQPLLSNQEEDQIKSWLCFPSDSNQGNAMSVGGDLNNKKTMAGLNNNTHLIKPNAVEAVVPSSQMAKINDVALVSEEKCGTFHAAKAKKKAKENKGSRIPSQAVKLGSSGKKREIMDTRFISPKRLRPPEVHRVTERKRRDKINEKIKALQELVPRCRKLDKASTLDKAIGYMKNLQMQLRMMSGGYDMSMQMFPQMPQPCMPPIRMFTDVSSNVPASHAIYANMNPGRMRLGLGMIPFAPALPYQHKPYEVPPVNLPFQHNTASPMIQFPQDRAFCTTEKEPNLSQR